MRNLVPGRIPFGLSLLALVMSACGGPDEAQMMAARKSLELWQREAAFRAMYYARSGSYRPWVPKKEFDCIVADFRSQIQHGTPGAHGSIGTSTSSLTVKVGALQGLIGDLVCESTDTIQHGVIVVYGLDGNDQFSAVLQVVCLDYFNEDSTYSYTATDDCYAINGDGSLTFKPNGLVDWMKKNNGGRNYWEEVVIQHDRGGPWVKFDSIQDVRMTIFPYETTLFDLIDHNSTEAEPLTKLRIEPMSVPLERDSVGNGRYDERGFFNSVCWRPEGVSLDDSTHIGYPYKAKAADLGSPCPPNCPMYRFRFKKSGMKPRYSCM